MFNIALISAIIFIFLFIYLITIGIFFKRKRNNIRILRKMDQYFIDRPKIKKYLILISIIYFLISIAILVKKITIILLSISFIFMIVEFIIYIKDTLSNKSSNIRIVGIVFMYGYIFLFGICLVGIVANNTASSFVLVGGILIFIIIAFFLYGPLWYIWKIKY